MKQTIPLATVGLLFSALASLQAGILFSENFDSYADGAADTTITNVIGDSSTVSTAQARSGDNSLKFTGDGTEKNLNFTFASPVTAATPGLKISFSYQKAGDDYDPEIWVMFGGPDIAFTAGNIGLRANGLDNIPGAQFQNTSQGATWQTVNVEYIFTNDGDKITGYTANFTTSGGEFVPTFAVTVTGLGISSIDSLRMQYRGAAGEVYLDDIKVEDPSSLTPVPETEKWISRATNDTYAGKADLRFNYAEALQKSVYFLETQQNGKLSPNNRVAWRGDANLTDGSDIKRDLAGGLFDAGDHWTANLTMAFVTTTLAWSAVEKPTGWTGTNQMDELLETLIHVNNYFIKCVLNPDVEDPAENLDVAIGCGGAGEGVPSPSVHDMWAGAEMADAIDSNTGKRFTNRPTFRLNSTAPGGDIPAAMASAMASSAMVIRAHGSLLSGKKGYAKFDLIAYADQLYSLAGKLAEFANAHKDAPNPNAALRSDGQIVDIGYRGNAVAQTFTAFTWLARATNDKTTRQSWVDLAEKVYEGPYKAANLNAWWRDNDATYMGKQGVYNMIRLFPDSEKYHSEIQEYTAYYLGYAQTPGGLRLREFNYHEYGSLRHTHNAGVIALYYSDLVDNAPAITGNTPWKHGAANATLKAELTRAAKRGTDYALGANPYGRSYLVGFGNKPFNSPHHRGAHGAWNGFDHFQLFRPFSNPDKSRNILYGALLAGPDNRDVFLCGKENRPTMEVPGTKDSETYYLFPNRPDTPVRKSTYVFDPADQPVQAIMDSKMNEVAIDYNAGFMANLVWLNANGYSDGSVIPDSKFPPPLVRNDSLDPWSTDREMFVTATVREVTSSAIQLEGKVWNRSRWPARGLKSPSIHYYFTHNGTVTPTLSNAEGASISAVKTDKSGHTYVEISWKGVTLYPVSESTNGRSFTLRLEAPEWDSADDWSHKNAKLNSLRVLPNTPVYQSGVLVGGAAPADSP